MGGTHVMETLEKSEPSQLETTWRGGVSNKTNAISREWLQEWRHLRSI